MADKAIDDLGRDQMEFAEEVRILFEKESKKEKKPTFLQFFFNFPLIFAMQIRSLFYIS